MINIQQMRILIIEDDPHSLKLFNAILRSNGYGNIKTALSGEEGLPILRNESIDLVILDIMLPGMNGYEICRTIKSDEATSHIPVIMITGGAWEEDEAIRKSFASGANDFITKPVRSLGFLARVESALTIKQTFDHVRESEAKFRALTESSASGVFITQEETFRYANPMMISILGYSQEELFSLKFRDIIHPDSKDGRLEYNLSAECGENIPFRCEIKILSKSGETRWLDCTGTEIEYAGRRAILGSVFDITERKRAEDALALSEEKYRTIFETTGTAMILVAEDTTILLANMEFEKLSGYSKEEIHGRKSWMDFFTEEDLGRMKEYHRLRRIDPSAAPRQYEATLVDRKGNDKDVFVTVAMVPGTIESMISLLDISERKRAENERTRLAAAIEQATESFLLLDSEGVIQYVNPAFEKLSGYSCPELLGRKASCLMSGHHGEGLHEVVWDTVKSGKVWTGRLMDKGKDGRSYEAETTVSPILDNSGRIINCVINKRDVTHEAHLERQLRQSQKMEAIGTLAGGIAHDFNNILMAIVGYTEMALCDLSRTESLKKHLDEVLKASNRAKDLVKQILTFSRQTEQERKPIQINPIVKEAVRFIRASLPATIEISQEMDAEPGTILADPTQIHQILMNLCSNAAHAMREKGGTLRIGLTNIEVITENSLEYTGIIPGPYVKLTVSDTGHGMDRKTRERVFEPFFSTKGQGEGTGMGLAVVHGIIKSHRGAISVSSEVGMGATFHVLFPRLDDRVPAKPKATKLIQGGTERLLVVDDEEAIVYLMKDMLERLGYEIVASTSGVDALEAFRNQPDGFDLVITDLTMPRMTGAGLVKEIFRIRPDIPTILCTGYSEEITQEEAKNIGIREFIMKPIVRSEMAATIRRALDGDDRNIEVEG